MDVPPAFRDVRVHVVEGAAEISPGVDLEAAEPRPAGEKVAQFPVDHGQGCGRLFHEQFNETVLFLKQRFLAPPFREVHRHGQDAGPAIQVQDAARVGDPSLGAVLEAHRCFKGVDHAIRHHTLEGPPPRLRIHPDADIQGGPAPQVVHGVPGEFHESPVDRQEPSLGEIGDHQTDRDLLENAGEQILPGALVGLSPPLVRDVLLNASELARPW